VGPDAPVLLAGATAALGGHDLWSGLDLTLGGTEFLAVIGPNGTGKTSLLRVLLGLLPLRAGSVRVAGGPPRRGNPAIGYVPQQRAFDPDLPLRGRDLVGLGLDGHRWGLGGLGAVERRRRIDRALEAVGAGAHADVPVGRLSGGEQQRLRVAAALVGQPRLLLCDEPLASLDLRHQTEILRLLGDLNRTAGLPLVLVTHDLHPVLSYVQRILCLGRDTWALGPPEQVLTAQALNRLYGTPVDVVRRGERCLILGLADSGPAGQEGGPA